jgi:hypothetical protein
MAKIPAALRIACFVALHNFPLCYPDAARHPK